MAFVILYILPTVNVTRSVADGVKFGCHRHYVERNKPSCKQPKVHLMARHGKIFRLNLLFFHDIFQELFSSFPAVYEIREILLIPTSLNCVDTVFLNRHSSFTVI